jgi:hypothetical protein
VEKVILLKTQLAEAAKFGKSEEFRFQRLAVILLDNFIEIQLGSLIKEKFTWDGALYLQEKKYKQKHRRKILNYHDELLKTSRDENFIDEKERRLLSFCHEVRNNLYHRIREEELLVNVALRILQNIIYKKQSGWKNANSFTAFTSNTTDPFRNFKENRSILVGNSTSDWEDFLKKYFNFIDKRKASASKLLSYNMIYKIRSTRENFRFLKEEFSIFFPGRADWDFNDFLLHYSFRILNNDKLEEIKEIAQKNHRDDEYKEAYKRYVKQWTYKSYSRLKEIEKKANELSRLEIYESLEIYISLRLELNMIYDSIKMATSELDQSIQLAIDQARGK